MKTIFTLLSSLILSVAVFAAAPPKKMSMLSINSASQGDIRVIVDGKRFEPNDNSLVINNLQSGYRTVKVYRQKGGGMYNIFGKRYELVYNASVYVKPRVNLILSIDRFGRTVASEQFIPSGRGNGRDWGHNNGGGRNNDWDDDDFDYDNDGNWGDYDGGYNNNYNRAMSDRDFNQVLVNISKEWLEANRMKSASSIIASNFLTSMQVKQMIHIFTFESNKLDLAKQAYSKTVDQRNFLSTVDDEFSFSSSRDELARFIRSIR
ncbi:MAG TPA: DUF4476 domain-containing protein [Chitinophagaceae bacterium]|jgi:hypothetical protein|nr:DUF4476 domain-containing protein [Chitinophagaceae bacterium]